MGQAESGIEIRHGTLRIEDIVRVGRTLDIHQVMGV